MIEITYEDTWKLMLKEKDKGKDELMLPSTFVKYIGGIIVKDVVLLDIFKEILARDIATFRMIGKTSEEKSDNTGISKDELKKKFIIKPTGKKPGEVSYISIKIIDKHIAYLSGATLIMYFRQGKKKKYILTSRGHQMAQFLIQNGYIDNKDIIKRHNNKV